MTGKFSKEQAKARGMTGRWHPIAMLRAELQGRTAPRYVAGPYYTNRAMRRAGEKC